MMDPSYLIYIDVEDLCIQGGGKISIHRNGKISGTTSVHMPTPGILLIETKNHKPSSPHEPSLRSDSPHTTTAIINGVYVNLDVLQKIEIPPVLKEIRSMPYLDTGCRIKRIVVKGSSYLHSMNKKFLFPSFQCHASEHSTVHLPTFNADTMILTASDQSEIDALGVNAKFATVGISDGGKIKGPSVKTSGYLMD